MQGGALRPNSAAAPSTNISENRAQPDSHPNSHPPSYPNSHQPRDPPKNPANAPLEQQSPRCQVKYRRATTVSEIGTEADGL